MREINALVVLEHLFMFLGYLKKHSNDRNCMDISSFWFINAKGLSLSHKIFRVAIMPKTSDGIDNILIYLQDEKISYRAGTDMVGKVFPFRSHVMSNFLQISFWQGTKYYNNWFLILRSWYMLMKPRQYVEFF